ncbi:PPK2 family polyphosphate kinase [Rugosimonospora africana]|uniref:PPK2 family polyphosphate kinase n=1 Tax=Rugosimonospora africana TaxID=556532 RepID=UPI001EF1A158|nr:PPK2 family polyphosphate kinase [Rugosimonospora africana]
MNLRDILRVAPGGRVDLGAIDPAGTPGLPKKAGKEPKVWTRRELESIGTDLASHQERLYAGAKAGHSRRRLLLVLQAMDCGGKDGTTKKVAGTMNPQGLHIVSFGKPSPEELAHDFLWRVRAALPIAGYVGVFNRSHYEDVLVARVHELVAPAVWRERYEKINQFERDLTRNGTTIVKVMLHISFEEQRARIEQRLDDPTKHWKYNPADVDERGYWTEYQEAYQDALTECSTDYAPWYVVPANRKWYRDWAVATLLREAFADLRLTYPEGDFDVAAERRRLAASTSPAKHRVTRR